MQRIEIKEDERGSGFIDPNGGWHQFKSEAMYYHILACCGCGSPEDIHWFFVQCLKCIDSEYGSGVKLIQEGIEKNPEIAAEFIAQYLYKKGLTDHGGTVYSSVLTDLGRQFIEFYDDDDKSGVFSQVSL